MRRCNVRALTVLCLSFACSLPALSAVKMTQTMVFHGYGPNNIGRSRASTTTLIQGNHSRAETSLEFEGKLLKRLTGQQVDVSITDLERKVLLNLQPKRETYTEMTFAQFLAQRDQLTEQLAAMRGQTPQQAEGDEAAGPKMEFGPPEVTVTKAGSAKIAGYDAELLDVRVKMVGSYPESTETCEINVDADLGFAKTPGANEVTAFYVKLAEGLGLSRSQLLGAGQSVLSAMSRYAEGFDKLYEEIRKQDGTLLRQNLRVKVKGACGGPPPSSGTSAEPATKSDGDEAAPPGARVKKMFGKLKLGRKGKDDVDTQEAPAAAPEAAAEDEFSVMMAVDVETETYEQVADVGPESFRAPAGWKKIETPGTEN